MTTHEQTLAGRMVRLDGLSGSDAITAVETGMVVGQYYRGSIVESGGTKTERVYERKR